MNPGAYAGNGAVQSFDNRSRPDGGVAVDVVAEGAFDAACASCAGDHSPQAVPAAIIPNGVSSMITAIASQSRRNEFAAGFNWTAGTVAFGVKPELPRSKTGSAACRYATIPAEMTASANPARVVFSRR